jgi:hypothetical protein
MKPWEQFTNESQWKEYLQNLVATNDKALYRSIYVIFQLQTESEKEMGITEESNKVGFSGVDAGFMTSLVEQINKGYALSPKQLAIARNKMKKYWKQLMRISKGG